jgi:signal transduction histidine kinase
MSSGAEGRLAQIVAADEAARARIVADIHDDTIQTLGAVALSLQNACDDVSDPVARTALEAGVQYVRDAAERVRQSMFELLPPLPAADLREAVEIYASVLFADSGLVHELVGGAPELPAQTQVMAYRLIQEALRNARRHSSASRIQIELARAGGDLQITVSDDGVGLRQQDAQVPTHAGLRIIRQRVESLGGTVSFDVGLNGRGTAVRLRLPLEGAAA